MVLGMAFSFPSRVGSTLQSNGEARFRQVTLRGCRNRRPPFDSRSVPSENTIQEIEMKRFMAVFTGSPTAFEGYAKRFKSEDERKANDRSGMQAWMNWAQKHGSAIVDMGAPLGRTKRVTKDGVADARNNLGAYTVVQAESQEAAAKMFLDHPHFTIFPGDGVEIMECLPIPQPG